VVVAFIDTFVPMATQTYNLPDTTPLKVVATHRTTFKETTTTMTAKEWRELKRNSNFYYKAYGID
jgi:hypothetical protein